MTLRVIDGGLAPLRVGDVTVHVVRDDEPLPFVIDAAVTEQDTWLTLGPVPEVLPGDDPNPLRTITHAHDVAAHELGTVDVRPGAPLLVRAIVIDVDADPPCTADSVEAATRAALRACRAHRARAVRFPLLGNERGRLDASASAAAIARAVAQESEGALDVALVVPAAAHAALSDVVRAAITQAV